MSGLQDIFFVKWEFELDIFDYLFLVSFEYFVYNTLISELSWPVYCLVEGKPGLRNI